MIIHITNTRQEKKHPPFGQVTHETTTAGNSRRGLWGMIVFLGISLSTLAVRDAQLLATLPETVRALLGDTPPPMLVHLALAASSISAVILILGRITGHTRPNYSWLNITMPVLFYPLYLMADVDRGSFIVVMAVGMTLLLMEHLTVRHCAVREDKKSRDMH